MDFDFGGIWDAIVGLLGGGAGEAAAGAAGDVAGTAAGAAGGGFGQGLMDLGSAAWQGFSNNPWGVLGTGLQTAGAFAPYMMGGGGPQQMQMPQWTPPDMNYTMPQGMQSQMRQSGVTPDQMRRRLSDAQAQGLSGASPDFLANLAGVTPDEVNKMMGLDYAYEGGQQGGR